MQKIQNDDIMKKVLTTMITISGRKTTEGYATSVLETLLKQLSSRYDFLKYIDVKDTQFLEERTPITVLSNVNVVSSEEIGKALYDIITTMNKNLGEDAGHFFIKEISRNLTEEYNNAIRSMGVDLNLMQLEHEVNELERRLLNSQQKA
ncbi:MAG: hypothetical protein QXX20_02370 [Candidatus Thermoplasmatota archaeon]